MTTELRLAPIRATSPSVAEAMRSCLLKAGLSRLAVTSAFVLGNPRAWLGVAYHEVLERIVQETDLTGEGVDVAVERLWQAAVARKEERARSHPLDQRYRSPTRWPGYHLTRASVLLRARELVHSRTGAMPADGRSSREQNFSACGGKLTGRPDVVRASEIVDYKSGLLFEYDETTQEEVIRAAYVRQLQIYGYLVKETAGSWPERGVLLPLAAPGVEVQLDPLDCEREAQEAVARLDEYNQAVLRSTYIGELASPQPENCKTCPYKLICPAFWQAVTPEWNGQLVDAVVEGTVSEAPQPVHDGAALAMTLDIAGGTELPRRVQIAPLDPLIHTTVRGVSPGDRLRITGLRVQSSGALQPTLRTVIARANELPEILLPGNTQEQAVA